MKGIPVIEREIIMSTVDELVVAYATARDALASQKEALKPYQKAADDAEAALFDFLESQNLRSVRHESLGLFMLSDLAEPRVEDSTAFVAWAEDAMPELLTANRARLGTVIREILRGDREAVTPTPEGLPPGVGFSLRRSINWRRS